MAIKNIDMKMVSLDIQERIGQRLGHFYLTDVTSFSDLDDVVVIDASLIPSNFGILMMDYNGDLTTITENQLALYEDEMDNFARAELNDLRDELRKDYRNPNIEIQLTKYFSMQDQYASSEDYGLRYILFVSFSGIKRDIFLKEYSKIRKNYGKESLRRH